jgi:hypothetical protein
MMCIGSIFFLILGALAFFAKDILWELTAWGNQMKGISSERSENWNMLTTIGGVVAIIFGLIALYAFFQGS